jgi:hypothetical protein
MSLLYLYLRGHLPSSPLLHGRCGSTAAASQVHDVAPEIPLCFLSVSCRIYGTAHVLQPIAAQILLGHIPGAGDANDVFTMPAGSKSLIPAVV